MELRRELQRLFARPDYLYNFKSGNSDITQGTDMSCTPHLAVPHPLHQWHFYADHVLGLAHVGPPAQRTFPPSFTSSFCPAFEFSCDLPSFRISSQESPLWVPRPSVFSERPVLPCLPMRYLLATTFSCLNPSLNHKFFKDWH